MKTHVTHLLNVALAVFGVACGGTPVPARAPGEPGAAAAATTRTGGDAAQASSAVTLGACVPYDSVDDHFFPHPAALEVDWAEAPRVVRCAEGSPEHAHARAQFDAFALRIEHAERTASAGELREALRALLSDRCFLPASEVLALPSIATAEGARAWWELGGKEWLEQYLFEMPAAASSGARRTIVFPPTEPRVLDTQTLATTDPLRALACAPSDLSCEEATAPYVARLGATLQQHAQATYSRDSRERPTYEDTVRTCERDARQARPAARYTTWYRCIESAREQLRYTDAPRVHAHAPPSGWLKIARWVRSNAPRACAEMCVYDFATGAAHCAEACGLHGAESSWETSVRRGNVNVEYLRELGWAMLVSSDVDKTAMTSGHYELPAGWAPEWTADEQLLGLSGTGGGGGHSLLEMAWIDGDCVRYNNIIATTDEERLAEMHVGTLQRVLAASFVAGTARARIPSIPLNASDALHDRDERLINAIMRTDE